MLIFILLPHAHTEAKPTDPTQTHKLANPATVLSHHRHLPSDPLTAPRLRPQWSLVCERASEAHVLQSLFMAGMTMASLPVGPLADRFGRRRIVLLAFGTQAVLMGALALAPNYGTFAVLR